MSDRQPANPGGPNPRRHPFATFLMVLVGIILLLPALCSIQFTGAIFRGLHDSGAELGLLVPWAVGLLIGALGIKLIISATRT